MVAVRQALAVITLAVAVDISIRKKCPVIIRVILSLVKAVDHPGALCDHRAQTGLEHRIRSGLGDSGLGSADGEELAHHFHARLAFGGADGRALMVIRDDLSAVVVDQIIPAVLVVAGIHRKSVDRAAGSFRDLLRRFIHVFPGPVISGIIHAVLIKDRLVARNGHSGA